MPLLHRLQPNNHYLHRLMVIFLTFSPIFVLLTISYEGLFYLGFCITLITWVRLEHRIYVFMSSTGKLAPDRQANGGAHGVAPAIPASLSSSPFRSLSLTDARVSLFFLTLLQSAFFSTGNVASISSFSLDSVYRLIPIFDPFSQGALLMLKLMIPFALISANLGILNRRLGVAPSALFMLVMTISDFLTLHFFWVVRDEGSWLEIGSTISHFCIASLLCLFVASLEGVSEMFIAGVEVDEDDSGQADKARAAGEVAIRTKDAGRSTSSSSNGRHRANGRAKGGER
jgi:phosphatidylinositol glycan class N